jgi:hypothetical protein
MNLEQFRNRLIGLADRRSLQRERHRQHNQERAHIGASIARLRI